MLANLQKNSFVQPRTSIQNVSKYCKCMTSLFGSGLHRYCGCNSIHLGLWQENIHKAFLASAHTLHTFDIIPFVTFFGNKHKAPTHQEVREAMLPAQNLRRAYAAQLPCTSRPEDKLWLQCNAARGQATQLHRG